MNETRPILTITGSDSTSGSGVQADIKTISELGGYAVTAITSITVQTSLGIQEFYDLPARTVAGQIDAVMNDFAPEVVKVGLIRTPEVLQVVVDALRRYGPRHVVYDPVFLSSRGDELVPEGLVEAIRRDLLPLCTLVIAHDAGLLHGMGNRYASAVAVYLNEGCDAGEAEARARTYVGAQVARASDLQGRASELYNAFLDALGADFRSGGRRAEAGGHGQGIVHYYAGRLNVSSRYLGQVTRRISGKAPKAIIDDFLIREIELQLNTTDRTVQEIAYSCGFSSQAHLTKFFRKLRGMSPTAFRKVKK